MMETVFRLGPRAQARKQLEQHLVELARAKVGEGAVAQAPRRVTRPGTFQQRWTDEQIFQAIRDDAARRGRPPRISDWPTATDEHPGGNYVAERMGWANAIEGAGFPRPQRGGAR